MPHKRGRGTTRPSRPTTTTKKTLPAQGVQGRRKAAVARRQRKGPGRKR